MAARRLRPAPLPHVNDRNEVIRAGGEAICILAPTGGEPRCRRLFRGQCGDGLKRAPVQGGSWRLGSNPPSSPSGRLCVFRCHRLRPRLGGAVVLLKNMTYLSRATFETPRTRIVPLAVRYRWPPGAVAARFLSPEPRVGD